MRTISGVVTIDVRNDERTPFGRDPARDHEIDRAIQAAVYAPFGADVTLLVAPRQYAPTHALDYLRANGQHLGHIRVHCSDPETISRWVTALRESVQQ